MDALKYTDACIENIEYLMGADKITTLDFYYLKGKLDQANEMRKYIIGRGFQIEIEDVVNLI